MKSENHLTPAKLLGSNDLPAKWKDADVAIICFTPLPNAFRPYVEEVAQKRFFLHSPNDEVHLCRFNDIPFLLISEVYGFSVGATTVEELVHHGINQIIAVGFAGAFIDAPIGQPFIARETKSDLPLARHYGVEDFVSCEPDEELYELLNACIPEDSREWGHYSVWNGNSLYREAPELIGQMKNQGCDVVNMDTLSIYAATPVSARDAKRSVGFIYIGTVTDAMDAKTGEWKSDLIEAVNRESEHPHDKLVKFLVESVLPRL
jgi:uridine phosphorylase